MKKNLLLALAVVLSVQFKLSAQSNIPVSGTDVTNSTFSVYVPLDQTGEADVMVINQGTEDLDFKVKRIQNSLVNGSSNYFCWTACYGPMTNVSPSSMMVAAGDTSNNFHGYYVPDYNSGLSSITYVWFDPAAPEDSTYVTINYSTDSTTATVSEPYIVLGLGNSSVSIVKNTERKNAIRVMANPVNEQLILQYELKTENSDSKVLLTNILGSVIKEIKLTQTAGKLNVPVSDLSQGVYFYTLKVDNDIISSKKFLVVH